MTMYVGGDVPGTRKAIKGIGAPDTGGDGRPPRELAAERYDLPVECFDKDGHPVAAQLLEFILKTREAGDHEQSA